MTFRVGQKVVCVETWHLNGTGYGDEVGPVRGRIYTIRDIGFGLNPAYPHSLQVRLAEITIPLRPYRGFPLQEPGFSVSRFRPIVERKTDISIFTAMLNPSKQGVDA
jgi:hypothetical protein